MKEQLIDFETAKLAKEKDFEESVEFAYLKDGSKTHEYGDTENWNGDDPWLKGNTYFSAPTQSLLQKWLREEHSIVIWVEPNSITISKLQPSFRDNGYYAIIRPYYHTVVTPDEEKFHEYTDNYDTYEQALEEGLQEALNLI